MNKVTLNVEGMSCEHCEKSIKNALESMSEINEVLVDLDGKTVTISFEDMDIEEIKEIIEEQGFDVRL